MADTQSTTKFRADISQLKKEMQAASRAVRLASSEFKAATAGMDDWSKSADGLSAKTKQLSGVLDGQNKKLELMEKELAMLELKKKALMQLLLMGIVRVKEAAGSRFHTSSTGRVQ